MSAIALKQYLYLNPTFTENEIDGASFLELTEADIKEIVKPLGIVKKILRLKKKVSAPTDRPTCTCTCGSYVLVCTASCFMEVIVNETIRDTCTFNQILIACQDVTCYNHIMLNYLPTHTVYILDSRWRKYQSHYFLQIHSLSQMLLRVPLLHLALLEPSAHLLPAMRVPLDHLLPCPHHLLVKTAV